MIALDCRRRELEDLLTREWLDTNGRGGYSSSTVPHCHARKYHGLLVANLDNPGGRFVLLSKLEDGILTDGRECALSIHKYPFVYYPSQEHHISEFRLDSFPRTLYRCGSVLIEKSIMLLYGEDTLLVRYRLHEAPESIPFFIRPLVAYRGIHELSRENRWIRTDLEGGPNELIYRPYEGMPPLAMRTNRDATIKPVLLWYRNFEYFREKDRGYPYQEDLFMPIAIEGLLDPGADVIVLFSTKIDDRDINGLWEREEGRRWRMDCSTDEHGDDDDLASELRRAARHFIIHRRNSRSSIVAGYHWFYEWGRDTLLSLPGLLLHTGRIDEAMEILQDVSAMRQNGLIPNMLSERDEKAAYNAVDASLWFFWCLQELLKVTGDAALVDRNFWQTMMDIVEGYRRGVPPILTLRPDGFLDAGDGTTQLTWMDAVVRGVPVTPRFGCPVEIEALWYNALSFVNELCRLRGRRTPDDINDIRRAVKNDFEEKFWIPGEGYLADCWIPGDERQDRSVRPNQIFALSLPYPLLTNKKKARSVIKKVTEELLTPFGLRSLSPYDPRYRGRYGGALEERDSAYHQGVVWPWLIGHYGSALISVAGSTEKAAAILRPVLDALSEHLSGEGIGFISEIFDGDSPHASNGCIAQAWSVAEVFRLTLLLGPSGLTPGFH